MQKSALHFVRAVSVLVSKLDSTAVFVRDSKSTQESYTELRS